MGSWMTVLKVGDKVKTKHYITTSERNIPVGTIGTVVSNDGRCGYAYEVDFDGDRWPVGRYEIEKVDTGLKARFLSVFCRVIPGG